MIQVQAYYTAPESVVFFQKDWCLLSAPKPLVTANVADDVILIYCQPPGWVDETDPLEIIVTLRPAASEVLADKRTRNSLKFQELVKQWKTERGSRSSITQAAMMQPYQSIIGMGEDAIPLIIAQLKSEGHDPDQWFWALRAITQENPVRPEDRGNFQKMAQTWIQWAERQGHAW
jgi:hypothetical protein